MRGSGSIDSNGRSLLDTPVTAFGPAGNAAPKPSRQAVRRPPARLRFGPYARLLWRMRAHLRRHWRGLVGAFSLSIADSLVGLAEPWPLKLIFDALFGSKPLPDALLTLQQASGGSRWPVLAVLAASIVVLALLSGLIYQRLAIVSARTMYQVVEGTRRDLWDRVQAMPWSYHSRRRTGDLMVRFVTDLRMVRDALLGVPLRFAESGLLLVGMGFVLLRMDWQLALVVFAAAPLLWLNLRRNQPALREATRNQRRREGDIADILSEALGGIRVLQAFGLEGQTRERLGGAAERGIQQGNKAARLEARMRLYSEVAVGSVMALVILLAALRIEQGALSPGDLIIFVTYTRTFARPLRRVSKLTEQTARMNAAAERLLEVLEQVPEIRDEPRAVPAPQLEGHLDFEGVSFSYGSGPRVLDRIWLRVRAGERVAIVGPTGVGKSTLLALVPRFLDPTEGRVLLDWRPIRGFTLESIRAQVSVVFQEPLLFSGSIADNIGYGRPGATPEEIRRAAERAGIGEIIERLPGGYDAVIGERGGTLSGGERQCVAIARALIRDAPIVLLDEPTTGLDRRSAAMVLDAIGELVHGRTVLFVTHQLEQVRDMDRILVLEEGRIVQDGTYAELMDDPRSDHWMRPAGDDRHDRSA